MVEQEYRIFVGIDWATEAHQGCVLDGDRQVLGGRSFAHTGEAIAAFAAWLGELAVAWDAAKVGRRFVQRRTDPPQHDEPMAPALHVARVAGDRALRFAAVSPPAGAPLGARSAPAGLTRDLIVAGTFVVTVPSTGRRRHPFPCIRIDMARIDALSVVNALL